MTQLPPSPQDAYDARRRDALLANLAGLFLLLTCVPGLLVVAWVINPWLLPAAALAGGIYAGVRLATTEAE